MSSATDSLVGRHASASAPAWCQHKDCLASAGVYREDGRTPERRYCPTHLRMHPVHGPDETRRRYTLNGSDMLFGAFITFAEEHLTPDEIDAARRLEPGNKIAFGVFVLRCEALDPVPAVAPVRAAKTALNHYPRMTALARSFPPLREAPIEPFDPKALDTWAMASSLGSGGMHAARFVLAVFSPHAPWGVGAFNAVAALASWDDSNRAAFVAWARAPWWV